MSPAGSGGNQRISRQGLTGCRVFLMILQWGKSTDFPVWSRSHLIFCFTLALFPQSPSPLTAVSLFSVHESVSILIVSLFCSLDSTYEWNHMVLGFLDWLISSSIMFSRSIHAVAKSKILFFFYSQVVFHHVNVPQIFLSTHLLMGTWAASKS